MGFIDTGSLEGFRTGGVVGMMRDPVTRALVTPRFMGELDYRATDLAALQAFAATLPAPEGGEDPALPWLRDQTQKIVAAAVGELVLRQKMGILDVIATDALAQYAPILERISKETLGTSGVELARVRSLTLMLSPEDEAALRGGAQQAAAAVLADTVEAPPRMKPF